MPLTPICFTFWSKEKRIVRPQKFHMPNKREILAKGVQKQAKGKPQQKEFRGCFMLLTKEFNRPR